MILCYATTLTTKRWPALFFSCVLFLLSIFIPPIPPPGPISFCPMQAIYPPLMHFDLQGLLLEENHRTPPIMQNAIINSLMFGKKKVAPVVCSPWLKNAIELGLNLFSISEARGGVLLLCKRRDAVSLVKNHSGWFSKIVPHIYLRCGCCCCCLCKWKEQLTWGWEAAYWSSSSSSSSQSRADEPPLR